MISNQCNYMDYEGGKNLTAEEGYVWLFGRRSKSAGAGLGYGL